MTPEGSPRPRGPFARGIVTSYGRGRDRRWRWSQRVGGRQIRHIGFLTEADAFADRQRTLDQLNGIAPTEAPLTLGAALDRLLATKSQKKSLSTFQSQARQLLETFGKDTLLSAITASRIAAYQTDRAQAGISAGGVNRPLALLRHVLRTASQKWESLAKVPFIEMQDEPEGRLRWLTHDEARRLLGACRERNHGLYDLVLMALSTGMRRGELIGLQWTDIDFDRGVIKLEVTKSGRRREIPFNGQLRLVLEARRQHTGHVHNHGRWDSFRHQWERAVEAAKLDQPLRFHDLRHTFASWAVQAGRPLLEIKEILGHQSLVMTMRYAHLSPDNARAAVAAVDSVIASVIPLA